nr:retrotransposon-like protein [Tanacetum cinerariifolium]
MFAFTSMGGKVDNSVNRQGRGPYVFCLHGQTYHNMGSLLPQEGDPPKFTQLYIYDTYNEIDNRARALSNSSGSSGRSNSKNPIDRDIMNEVKDVLDTSSDLVKTFSRAHDRYNEDSEQNIRIKLVAKRGRDGQTYNLPTSNEVAGLIVGDFDTCIEQRDIVIEKHREERLYFHRAKQSKLRCDTYLNICSSIAARNTDPIILGKPVVLSSLFTGGPRYMRQNYMDAMALCRWYGCLDLFITITCNPNWPEIARYMREHKLTLTDRPDTRSIKYLFKYINEGPDRVSAELYEPDTTIDGEQIQKPVDEIKAYLDCRYLSAYEAACRLFGFEVQYRTPSVERLSFHLPGEQ